MLPYVLNFIVSILISNTCVVVSEQGSNETLLQQIFTENWSSRPNVLNPVEGDGPYREGAKKLFSFFDLMIPGAKLSRKKTLICGNQVRIEIST